LYRIREWSILDTVNVVRNITICIQLVALSTASIAGSIGSCGQDTDPQPAQGSVVESADNHAGSHHNQHSQTQDLHADKASHHSGENAEATLLDCSCCSYCVAICGAAGCGMAASSDFYDGSNSIAADISGAVAADWFHEGPKPHPLFRPPILIS